MANGGMDKGNTMFHVTHGRVALALEVHGPRS